MPTILIGADLCPIEGNRPFFQAGDAQSLFHDLLPEFAGADLVVANLECPLIERPSPIFKTGPTFGEPGDCINGIKAAGIDVLCLANNHILDHGEPGLRNTLAVCERAGVATVGAGANLAEARRILIRQIGVVRVGILAVAEHEFSIATRHSWGANPLDVMDFVRDVTRQRKDFDYLIVLLHGSGEFVAPTPRIQNTCRFLIEMGANAVIVQHPHILGGCEEYQGGHIVYGQGALIMDEAIYRDRPSFHEGFLVKLTIEQAEDGGQKSVVSGPLSVVPSAPSAVLSPPSPDFPTPSASQLSAFSVSALDQGSSSVVGGPRSVVRRAGCSTMELIPFVQSAPVPGARKLTGEREQQFRQSLAQRSAAILDPAYVEAEWLKFCRQHQRGYLSGVLGHNRYVRKLDVGGWISKLIHSRRSLLGTRNIVLCETHREAIETIFNSRRH